MECKSQIKKKKNKLCAMFRVKSLEFEKNPLKGWNSMAIKICLKQRQNAQK